MLRLALAFGVAALAITPALAGEIRPDSIIDSVTVYPLGANVTRRVPVTLPPGTSVVVVDDLPAGIDTASLKVDGTADQPIEISSVETRLAPADADSDPKRQALVAEIEAIKDKIDGLNDEIAALAGRRDFVMKLIQATPAGFGKALGAGADGVDRWGAAAEAIGGQLAAIAEAERGINITARKLKAELADRNKALAALKAPAAHMVVRIEVSAEAGANGALTLGYRESAARWEPTYDALLDTGDATGTAKLTIVRRAEVTQATGEDWTNVALTLSTTRPAGGTAAPELDPLLAAFLPPMPVYRSRAGSADSAATAPAPAAPPMSALSEAGPAKPKSADSDAAIVEAAADFGDFRAEYRVPGKVTVESGVGARGLRITTETGTPELEVRAVPALAEDAFLHAAFTGTSGAPFLAGRAALFRDGSFVGNGAIPFTNSGKKLDLGFGTDDLVRVTRAVVDHATGQGGILSSRRTETRRFKITVENLHKQTIKITVVDRVPYAEDDKIKIERLAEATKPTLEGVDDRRGVLAWSYSYAAGERRDIQNAYQVSWPSDQTVLLDD